MPFSSKMSCQHHHHDNNHDHQDCNNSIHNSAKGEVVAAYLAERVFDNEEKAEEQPNSLEQMLSLDEEDIKILVREQLQDLLQLFVSRVSAYNTFEAGLRLFRENKNEIGYHAVCDLVMKKFQDISKNIREIEGILNSPDKPHSGLVAQNWAQKIRSIQENEQNKLQLTAQLHMLHVTYTVAKDEPWSDQYRDEVSILRREIDEVVEKINESIEDITYFVQESYA